MKKVIMVLLSACFLFGCSCKRVDPFTLSEEYYTVENKGFSEVTSYDEIQALEDEKKSFAVYVYLPGCITCMRFSPILSEYLDDNNLMFYSITTSRVKETKNSISKVVEYASSIVLFKDGEVVAYLDATNDKHTKYYEDKESLSEWIEQYIILENKEVQ